MLTVVTRTVNDVTVLDLRGRLVVGDSLMMLRGAVRKQISQGTRRILLNFAETDVDSAGLGEILFDYVIVAKQGGELRICSPENTFRNQLEITKLKEALQVFSNESDALSSFALAAAA